jgi:hypothetical protein
MLTKIVDETNIFKNVETFLKKMLEEASRKMLVRKMLVQKCWNIF